MKTIVQFLSLSSAGLILALWILPTHLLLAGDEFTMDSARAAVAAGDPKAEFFLGKHYAAGIGVPVDYTKAVEYLTQSANQGYAPAETALGSCYALGDGVPLDYSVALEWYRKAAAQGDALAEYCLGFASAHGKGAPKDMNTAIIWWQKAAEQGQVYAQNALGQFYFHGEYVDDTNHVNLPEAFKWFHKAAEQDYAPAMGALGYMYQYGVGVKQNWTEALKWSRRGAELGDSTAEDNLGLMYEGADAGLPHDAVQAYKWFLLSEAQGCPLGRHDAMEIEIYHALTEKQMAEARRMTNAFTATMTSNRATPQKSQE